MRTIDVLAKTKEEAIAKAMAELNVPMERLEVEVIEEATKGFLGLIGKKECHIRVTELDDTRAEEFATEFLNGLFEVTNTDCSFTCEKDEDGILHINVEGEESSLFIGRRGDTLDALQMLTTLVVNRQLEDFKRGFPYLKLEGAATPTKGVIVLDKDACEDACRTWQRYQTE